jgi:hypothetical protein
MAKYIGISKPLMIVSGPQSNLDSRYGPYKSVDHALQSIPREIREVGLTVIVKDANGEGIEYWWKRGIEDADLTLKIDEAAYTKTSQLENDADFQNGTQVAASLQEQKTILDAVDANLQNQINTTNIDLNNKTTNLQGQITTINQKDAAQDTQIQNIITSYIDNKGYFASLASLQTSYPSPEAGDTAYVANALSSTGYYIYNVVNGVWTASTVEAPPVSVPINDYAQHGYESSPKTLKQVHDFILREQVPMLYKAANFDIYITGNNLIIKNQIQYGETFFLGVPDATTIIDLTSSSNWMGGISPTDYMFVYIKSGGTFQTGSEIKLGDYSKFALYTDYIPVVSISRENGAYYLNNVVGYPLKDRKDLSFVIPFIYSGTKFKTSISGNILTLYEQLQYGNGHFLGVAGGTKEIDLSDLNNWLEGSISNHVYLMVKNDGTFSNPSTLKLISYEHYTKYGDYIPAIALEKKAGIWYVLNILGYQQKENFELIDIGENEITEHDGVLTTVNGYIGSDGSVKTDSTGFKSATPIAITDDNSYILFRNSNSGRAPNYVNCYTNNDFTGFLGRSDGLEWITLTLNDRLSKPLKLAPGTKFISFLTESPYEGSVLTSVNIVSFNDFKETIINYDNTEYHFTNPVKFLQSSYRPYQSSPIRFQIPVNCRISDYLSNTIEFQDGEEIYNDWGVLMLPESYSATGKPTRLIIGCHGAGGSVDGNQSQIENITLYKYLCANGFAIMDMNGLPQGYASLKGIDYYNNIGSPIAVQSYIKGVQWVLENYNICKDGILIDGGSMGGITSSNIVLSKSLNIIAHSINCPVLDTYNHIWLNPWSGGLPKTAMIKIYGFAETTPGSGIYVYDEEKLKGFNPVLNGMISFDKTSKLLSNNIEVTTANALTNLDEVKKYPCPVKIWHSTDDPIVNFAVSQRHINSIRKGGQIAYLRSIPSGGHAPLEVGEPLTTPSGNTNYKGTTLSIKPIVEEIYLWFKRFNN